jgi:hypothetical protein
MPNDALRRSAPPSTVLPDVGDKRARRTGAAFRAVATVHALAVFGQPILAGRFMNGDTAMLELHGDNAVVVGVLGIVQLIVAILCWRIARGGSWPCSWPVPLCVGLALAEPLQIFFGFNRVIGLHVPLGVAIVATTVVLLISVWTRPRAVGAGDNGGDS